MAGGGEGERRKTKGRGRKYDLGVTVICPYKF